MQATPEQKKAIETRGARLCVDAGAGSGKTRVLVERIIHLLEQKQASLEEIVAITYTEKAAAEMKARLRRAFHERAPDDNPREMSRWRELERRVDTARISTIHSFCGALLRENALRLNLDPDFGVLDEAQKALMVRDTVRTTLHGLLAQGYAPALILATEKRVSEMETILVDLLTKYAAKLARWKRQHYPWDNAEALAACWNKTLNEEQVRRFKAAPHTRKVRKLIEELHECGGACSDPTEKREALRKRALLVFETMPGVENREDIKRLIDRYQSAPERTAKASKKPWNSEEKYKRMEALLKQVDQFMAAQNALQDPDPVLEKRGAELTVALMSIYYKVLEAFTQAKQTARLMDFEDMIAMAAEALADTRELRVRVAQGIRFLLIDEFQDTDDYQTAMARRLADEEAGPELFIVGDAKQSIYRFRGAELEVFLEERRQSTETLPLRKNFRSLPDVIEFINHFFSETGVLDGPEPYPPMEAHRDAMNEPRVEFLHTDYLDSSGKSVNVEEYRSAEAAHIAERILEMCGSGQPLVFDEHQKTYRSARFGDVAVLFRAMSNVNLYENALRKAGVPYVLSAGSTFYECQEVRDVANVLSVLVDPWNESALLGFLRGPMAGLSDESIYQLGHAKPLPSTFMNPDIPENFDQAAQMNAARNLLKGLRQSMHRPLPELLHHVLELTGFEAVLLSQSFALQKTANIRKLLRLGADFARQGAGLSDFVTYINEMGKEAVREGEATVHAEGEGAVTLLTVHKSKGLEFPLVFIADMGGKRNTPTVGPVSIHRDLGVAMSVEGADGVTAGPVLVKAIRARDDEEEERESMRLLYVAMTRARDFLCLCGREQAGNWFSLFEDTYKISLQPDGSVFGADAWQACVRHRGAAPQVPMSHHHSETEPEFVVDEKQTGPVCTSRVASNTFSISAILDHFSEGFDEQEERDIEERPSLQHAGRFSAIFRGTLTHRYFELWDFAGNRPPDVAALLQDMGVPLGERAALQTHLESMAARFRQHELHARLASQPRIQRELPFLLRAGDALVSGTIDALLDDGGILDYKTGKHRPECHARYEWQLRLYAAAVRDLGHTLPREGLLYYVDENRLYSVSVGNAAVEDALCQAREAIQRMRSTVLNAI